MARCAIAVPQTSKRSNVLMRSFKPDGEQQQQHAGVGEIGEHRRALHAERREHETRCQETDERRQADARDRKTQQ